MGRTFPQIVDIQQTMPFAVSVGWEFGVIAVVHPDQVLGRRAEELRENPEGPNLLIRTHDLPR